MQLHHLASPIGDAPIYFLRETESTMIQARHLVDDGAPSGVVVLTDFQSAGRGRIPGRQWVSPPGESLMFTVAMKTHKPLGMPLRAGLAVARTLESICGLEPRLKWPNDVMIGNRKICGILCEYSSPWLFVGVGLNTMQQGFPETLSGSATSIAMESDPADHDRLLMSILSELGKDLSEWRTEVERRLWHRDEESTITMPNGTQLTGTIVTIDDDGCLVMDTSGTRISVSAGELFSGDGREGGKDL